VPHAGPDELLGAYDDQLRRWRPDRLPAGETAEEDGPLLRFSGGPGGGWVLYRDLDGVEGAALDELILRQVRFFEERGDRFEWKYHGYDLPADLPERLRAAGFVPEATETIVIAPVDEIADEPRLPEGVSLREVTDRADFERIAAMETRVWGERNSWLPDMLESERSVDPDALTVVAAEADAPPGHQHKSGGFAVNISLNDAKEGERVFRALEESGTVIMPYGETFWAVRYGMLTDRFGITWMVNVEKPVERAASR